MAMSMKEKSANTHVKTEWAAALKTEFAREAERPNGCVGSELLSETEKTRVWMIRLKPGERIGFHRHVLNYFWTAVTPCRGRQHLMDGTTVEYSYYPGETRHETYGAGEFKVHDLENLGDEDMIFMTVESIEGSANKPLPVPETVRLKAA
jgi:quercetin dioxygenase-like cupin family protein